MNVPGYDPILTTTHVGGDAFVRLSQLGIASARLDAALDAGDIGARQADRFSPVMAAGTRRWLDTVQVLRSGLAADGWSLDDTRNSPRVISPEGRTAVVAVSGGPGTGIPEADPRTARPRGATSVSAVQVNQQLEFDGVLDAVLADMAAERNASLETWFLLYFRSKTEGLRAELSRPVLITDGGSVRAWAERIILQTRTFDDATILPIDAGGSDDVDFDIPVAR